MYREFVYNLWMGLHWHFFLELNNVILDLRKCYFAGKTEKIYFFCVFSN